MTEDRPGAMDGQHNAAVVVDRARPDEDGDALESAGTPSAGAEAVLTATSAVIGRQAMVFQCAALSEDAGNARIAQRRRLRAFTCAALHVAHLSECAFGVARADRLAPSHERVRVGVATLGERAVAVVATPFDARHDQRIADGSEWA